MYTHPATNADFIESYEVRQSFVIFVFRIVVLEIFILLFHFSLVFLLDLIAVTEIYNYSVFSIETVFIHFLNTVLVVYKTLSWFNCYFVMSSRALTRISGVFNRDMDSQDIRTISSVKVKQSLFGYIFNFGTIRVENPFSRSEIVIANIANPEKWAGKIKFLKDNALRDRPFTEEENVYLARFNH